MRRILIVSLCMMLFLCQLSNADMGLIGFRPEVKIFEPRQRALIAYNGEEEILLLSTDVKASGATKVLEVLPLPSEPKVKKGDVEVFKKATNLINDKLRKSSIDVFQGRGSQARLKERPAGEVTFHEKIGAHDISVTHVLDSKGFIDWVNGYLRSAGVENPVISEKMKESVAEYLAEGFHWFVFDVIELDEALKTHEAIQYRFATKSLFYPLKISRTTEGWTRIDLLILTPQLLTNFPGIARGQVKLLHKPIDITSEELNSLSPEMNTILGYRNDMKLRIWQIEGELSAFDKDLIAN